MPVYKHAETVVVGGGAANVALNIHDLGLFVHAIGVVGADDLKHKLSQVLSVGEKLTSELIEDHSRKTSVKSRYIAGTQHLLRIDDEDTHELSDESLLLFRQALDKIPWKPDVVVLSDYAKGLLSPSIISMIRLHSCLSGAIFLADPKGLNWSKYDDVDVLTPNKHEAESVTGMRASLSSDNDFLSNLKSQCECKNILLKLGSDGMALLNNSGEPVTIPPHAVDVADTVGAGDSVIATLAVALASGLDLHSAARASNYVASLAVQKRSTATVPMQEIIDLLPDLGQSRTVLDNNSHIDKITITESVKRAKKSGNTIGFTNGVFDLLHSGHLSLLEQLHAICDFLIVGVNSDSSVKQLEKGQIRPIIPQEQRAYLLSKICFVDMVVIFNETTPLDLINLINPDILLKGKDYTGKDVVGSHEVLANGGEVVFADFIYEQSTSKIIQKIHGKPMQPQ